MPKLGLAVAVSADILPCINDQGYLGRYHVGRYHTIIHKLRSPAYGISADFFFIFRGKGGQETTAAAQGMRLKHFNAVGIYHQRYSHLDDPCPD